MNRAIAAVVFIATSALAGPNVGDELKDVNLQTADEKPATVPSFGQKVLAIFYNDGDTPDLNDPLADAITAMKPNEAVYRGIGIANLADSKAPNFIIRGVIKDKIAKYNSTIVTDLDLSMAKAWSFGDCNNTAAFVIVGTDKKVKYYFKGAVRGAEITKVTALLKDLIAEEEKKTAPAPAPAAAAPTEAAPAAPAAK